MNSSVAYAASDHGSTLFDVIVSIYNAIQKIAFGTYAKNEGPDQTAHPQSGLGLLCSFTETLDTVDYIDV